MHRIDVETIDPAIAVKRLDHLGSSSTTHAPHVRR